MKTKLLLLFLLPVWAFAQTTRNAGTAAELNSAVTASASNDIINITANIVVNSAVLLNKSLVINGNDYTITVPVPGLDEMGRFATSPSSNRVFDITTTNTNVTINNLTIMGGNLSTVGGAITVASGTVLRLNNCIITRSRSVTGGGAIVNYGTLFLNRSYVIRNAGLYAGGILNSGSSARAYVENSTLVENRSTGSGSGGGAVENQSSAIMYFNNATLSNNQSTEIGGAINNNNATVFFVNSSATGNVCFGSSNSTGGAIGNNSGTVQIVNSLLAHNYRRTTGDVNNPTGYVLDDVRAYAGQNGVHIYYSIIHANLNSGAITGNFGLNGSLGTNLSNISYTGAANGSDNTIFSGGILTRITDNNGVEIGDQIYRPFLLNNAGSVAPTLQPASFVLNPSNRGTRTRFANNNNVNPVVAYHNGSIWVNLTGTSAPGQEVVVDQINLSRPNPPARGAMEGVASNLFMVKVNVSADGTVSGGSFQGDVYPSGTQVTLTAIPNAGRAFVRWDRTDGTPVTNYSSSNPLTITVTENITLLPVFTTLSGGQFTITYAGNGNTGGTAPAGGTFSASTTLAGAGTLTRTGYTFSGWNTNANGSGTGYAPNATYSGPANLTLYAQWQEQVNTWTGISGTMWNVVGSWSASSIAPDHARVLFASNASDHLTLEQHRTIRRLEFNGATRGAVLGNFNLTVSEAITQFGSSSYVRTTGTGRLVLPVNPSQTRTFPIGNSGYNPLVILNRTGRNEEFSVLVKDEVYQNGVSGTILQQPRVRRTWDISNTYGNTNVQDGIDMTFSWSPSEATGVNTPALYHYENGKWNRVTGDITSSATSLTIRGYKGTFSPFAIIEEVNTLPVTWLSLDARCTGNNVVLQWSTAAEQDNSHFVVERNTTGSWEALAQVAGRGTTSQPQQYQYVDNFSGTAQYRLRQVDFSGRESLSAVVAVRCDAAASAFRIFPNPASERLTISGAAAGSRYRLLNSTGQPVREGVIMSVQQTVDIRQLPAGAYYLQVQGANGQLRSEPVRIQ